MVVLPVVGDHCGVHALWRACMQVHQLNFCFYLEPYEQDAGLEIIVFNDCMCHQ
jgi:hypothetical protein